MDSGAVRTVRTAANEELTTKRATRQRVRTALSGLAKAAALERRVHVMADSQSITDLLIECVAVLLAVAFLAACAWCYARKEGAR